MHSQATITAAIYVRTAAVGQRSVHADQEAAARAHAETRGLFVAATYTDADVSGLAPLTDRPAGRRLMADAGAGRFEAVIVTDIARIGRDERAVRATLATLDRLGVRVETVAGEVLS